MPILSKQCEMFPDDLMDLPTESAPWEVAHLRSRSEKAVARILSEARMPFFLPQMTQSEKRSGRTFVTHLPMFPGYIFLRRVEGLRQALWRTQALANMIEVADQDQLTADLAQIRRLQAGGAVLRPCPEIVCGDAVRIQDGVFSGYTGVVMEERGSLRLIVSVAMLKKCVTVEFSRELLVQVKPSVRGREAGRSTPAAGRLRSYPGGGSPFGGRAAVEQQEYLS